MAREVWTVKSQTSTKFRVRCSNLPQLSRCVQSVSNSSFYLFSWWIHSVMMGKLYLNARNRRRRYKEEPLFSADTCPKPPTSLLCNVGVKNICTNATNCVAGTLCCSDGCRKRCRDPSENNRGFEEGKFNHISVTLVMGCLLFQTQRSLLLREASVIILGAGSGLEMENTRKWKTRKHVVV